MVLYTAAGYLKTAYGYTQNRNCSKPFIAT